MQFYFISSDIGSTEQDGGYKQRERPLFIPGYF
jgi:hypothetical protein